MQSRLYPFATIIAAATSIALTTLPWITLEPAGLDISWNGLAMTDADMDDVGVVGIGWAVVAAAVVAILAALIGVMPSPKVAPLRPLAYAIASAACALTALAPIITLFAPSVYYGDLFTSIGAESEAALFPVNKPVIAATAVAVLVTAALCAASVVAARSVRASPATTP